MKTIILASTLLFSLAANGQNIPDTMYVETLPSSLAILVNKEMRLTLGKEGLGWFSHDYNDLTDDPRGFMVACKNPQIIKNNDTLPTLLYVSKIETFSTPIKHEEVELGQLVKLHFSSDEIPADQNCLIMIFASTTTLPITVGDTIKFVGKYISLVDSDPYANLDNETAQKIIMKKITKSLEGGSYKEALPYFAMLDRRQDDLPEEFYYYYVDSLKRVGENKKAYFYAVKYLGKFGKVGQYYERMIDAMAEL